MNWISYNADLKLKINFSVNPMVGRHGPKKWGEMDMGVHFSPLFGSFKYNYFYLKLNLF